MNKLILMSFLVGGCHWYFGDDPTNGLRPDASTILPDASTLVADASPTSCLTPPQRTNDCEFALSGRLVDFSTGEGVAGEEVLVTTAWDTLPLFPAGCDPLAVITSGVDGVLDTAALPCDSPQFPPIALFISGAAETDGRHAFAVDARLSGCGFPCSPLAMDVPTISDATALDWRTQLEGDGMAGAAGGGLVIMQFLEADGTPAAGVAPTLSGSPARLLTPATEVRFLAGDRLSLVRLDAAMTGISGLAIIHLAVDETALIGGVRGDEVWESIGVLFADGHIFHEERTVSP